MIKKTRKALTLFAWYIEYQQGRRIEKYDQKQIDYWASIASAETGYIRYLLIKQIKEAGDQSVYNLTMVIFDNKFVGSKSTKVPISSSNII